MNVNDFRNGLNGILNGTDDMSGLGHHNPIPVANRNQAVMSTIARLLLAQGHGVIDNVQANINWNYIVLGVGARLLVF